MTNYERLADPQDAGAEVPLSSHAAMFPRSGGGGLNRPLAKKAFMQTLQELCASAPGMRAYLAMAIEFHVSSIWLKDGDYGARGCDELLEFYLRAYVRPAAHDAFMSAHLTAGATDETARLDLAQFLLEQRSTNTEEDVLFCPTVTRLDDLDESQTDCLGFILDLLLSTETKYFHGQRPNRAHLHLYLIKNGVFNRSAVEHK